MNAKKIKLSKNAKKLKKELEAAFVDIKLHQQGKIKLTIAQDLLKEL